MAGAAEALAPGTLWLQMSTVGIEATERLAQLADRAGLVFVDAPVLGTKGPAEQGALVVLASGPDAARERCAPLFDAVAAKVHWVGPAGQGSRLKLVVNHWLLGMVGLLAETLAFADCAGVDPELFFEAIDGGPVGTPYAQLKGHAMVADDHPASFPLRLAAKDLDLIRVVADSAGLELGVLGSVARRFADAVEAGHGDDDVAAVRRVVR